jgi:hypothetical protein
MKLRTMAAIMPTLLLLVASIDPARGTVLQEEPSPVVVQDRTGRTVDVNGGRVGQRQTREQAAPALGVNPMARVNSRIPNRVQSRMRNRIDQYYDPSANARSPFVIAEAQARSPKR